MSKEKRGWKDFNERKRELEAAIDAVDEGLEELAVKPGRKRTARESRETSNQALNRSDGCNVGVPFPSLSS